MLQYMKYIAKTLDIRASLRHVSNILVGHLTKKKCKKLLSNSHMMHDLVHDTPVNTICLGKQNIF